MEQKQWEVGQTVEVQSRTWAGINKPGGCAKITKVYYMTDDNSKAVVGLDVKYLVGGGSERQIDPCLVSHFETLQRGGRERRGREFLHQEQQNVDKSVLSRRRTNTNANSARNAKGTKDSKAKRSKANNNKKQKKKNDVKKSSSDTTSTNENDEQEEEEHDKLYRDAGSTEAAVEESQSDQQQRSTSTAFSSVNTPPKKRPRNFNSSKPTKVTPIPSLVITDDNKEQSVSPMFPDTDPSTTNRRRDERDDGDNYHNYTDPSAVRRGLFQKQQKQKTGKSNGSTKYQRPTAHQQHKKQDRHHQNKTGQNLDTKPRAETVTTSNVKTSSQSRTVAASRSNVATMPFSSSRAFGGPSMKDNFLSSGGIDRLSAARKKSVQSFARSRQASDKTSMMKDPPQPSATSFASAATTTASSAAVGTTSSVPSSSNSNRKALKDVYEYELRKAHEFMDQMVGPGPVQPEQDQQGDVGRAKAHPSSSSRSPSSATKKKEGFIRTSTRYNEFLSIFQTLRHQIDDEEGEISENQFKARFQTMTSKSPFDGDELDGHIASLCSEGKIMRSDGVLYLID